MLPSSSPFPPVSQIIPHQPPMRLLDEVIACDEFHISATASLHPGCPFWTQSGVPACIGLEYLGQTAAAFFSVLANSTSDTDAEPPRPGMLIASSRYECSLGYFPLNRTLRIEVSPASPVTPHGLVKFTGTLTDFESATFFAKGDISVYLPPA